nr:hypothetical protein [Treponema sp.]
IFSIVYGLKLGLLVNPLFYIGLISVFLAFSSLILAVIYILLIGLLLLFPFLRKKSVLTGIASFLIIIFAASYGFLTGFSSATMDFSSTSTMTMPLALRLSAAVDKIPFIHFCGSALDGKVLPVLILLALSALVIFGLLPLFASLYAKTLAGFADVKSKRLSKEKAEAVIKESKINTAFKSLLIRDVRTVFREPSFFANGPLMVFLFPLILIVSTTVPVIVEGPEGGLGALVSAARSTYLQTSPEKLNNIFFYASIAISGIMYFSGTSSNVACTAFSREGKSLSNLKAMPVTFETILKVKFWHSMLYIFVDQIIFALLLTIANLIFGSLIPFSLLIRYFLAMCVLTIAASIPLIFTDLILDAANPKLNWENPAAAFKQNFNAVIGMLCSILMIGIMVGLGMLFPKSINSLIYISAIFIVIGAPLGALYFRYGVKRLINM